MKKLVSVMALAAFLLSLNVTAQEKQKEKETAKKECSMKEKSHCSKDKKAGCCAKKADKKA